MPETDRRNAVCLQMCRDAGFDGPQQFSREDFHVVRDVPVFAEHTTKDKHGNLVVYDRNALEAIAERCNHRIQDTGDFPPITEGHTPTREEIAQGAKMPPVLGYAGNFRLGMIGNKNPRWAIFCDEYQHQEDVQKLRKLRRRSPEVWLEERMEDRFFDPIAALGAETPRLDMGMARFGRHHDGREVEKYSASFAGPMSTFIPNEKYEGESMPQASPELINEFMDALFQTDLFQYLQSKMEAEQGGMGNEPPMGEGMGEGMPPGEPDGDEGMPPTPPTPPMGEGEPTGEAPQPAYDMDDDDKDAFSRYMAGDMDDAEMAEYRAGKRKKNRFYQADCGDKPPMATDTYSRQQERVEQVRYQKLEERTKALEAELEKSKAEKRQAERYSRLADLEREGVELDVKEELADTADYSDDQFEKHLDRIAAKYSRIPLEDAMPRIHAPSIQPGINKGDQEKQARYSRRAVEIHTAAANAGKPITSDEAFAKAKAEIDAA